MYKQKQGPCKTCHIRQLYCHSTCEQYAAWKQEKLKEKKYTDDKNHKMSSRAVGTAIAWSHNALKVQRNCKLQKLIHDK